MNLKDAIKIKESLQELSVDVESFSWGPTYEFAKERKAEAIKLINKEIRLLKENERSN